MSGYGAAKADGDPDYGTAKSRELDNRVITDDEIDGGAMEWERMRSSTGYCDSGLNTLQQFCKVSEFLPAIMQLPSLVNSSVCAS